MLGDIRGVLLRVELRTHVSTICIMYIYVKTLTMTSDPREMERREVEAFVPPLREHLAKLFARLERQRRLGEPGMPLPAALGRK
jgi:hypothetical protein